MTILLLTVLPTTTVFGIGFRIPNQDPEAIGRANAFAATADNPAAIYYNPSGITQSPGQNLQIGLLNYLGIDTKYDSPTGVHSDTEFEVLPIPQVYYTYSPSDFPFSFGLGVYAPFGLGVEWPQASAFRSLAIESRLQYITVSPVVAWKLHPKLSLAMGPTVNYSKVKFNRGIATPSDFLEFKGDDFDLGFIAGLLWQPHPQWSFGATYRSATTMNYGGKTTYDPGMSLPAARTSARVPFPQIAAAGISYRPTPQWNIEVDVDWANWNTLNTVTLKGTSATFGADLPLQFNWHDSWLYELGVTRYFNNGWFVSVGYFFCEDTASEQNYTPAIPDTELHVGSLGFGHKGEHWRWAVAAQIITGPVRTVSNSQGNPFTGESPDGKYQLTTPTVSFSAGYHF